MCDDRCSDMKIITYGLLYLNSRYVDLFVNCCIDLLADDDVLRSKYVNMQADFGKRFPRTSKYPFLRRATFDV